MSPSLPLAGNRVRHSSPKQCAASMCTMSYCCGRRARKLDARQAVMPDLARTISYMPERRMTFTRFREDIRTCLTKRRRRTHCEGIAVGRTNWLSSPVPTASIFSPWACPAGWGARAAASPSLRRIRLIAQGALSLYGCRQRSIAAGQTFHGNRFLQSKANPATLARLIHQAGRERGYSWRWGGGEFGGGGCIAAGSDRWVGAGGWREGSWTGRQRPRGLWPGGHQGRRDVAEERRLWASRGKGEADAGGGLDDAGAEL